MARLRSLSGSFPDLRVERVPTVLRRVKLVGEEDGTRATRPHARRPRCVYPHRLQYLRVFDAVPFARQRRRHGAVQEYRHPGFEDSDLYTETLG